MYSSTSHTAEQSSMLEVESKRERMAAVSLSGSTQQCKVLPDMRSKMREHPCTKSSVQLGNKNSDDLEFEMYARKVEKSIMQESKATRIRLQYINQLRTSLDPTITSDETMADVVLPDIEDTIDTEQSIITSAIEDGNIQLLQNFLKDLNEVRKKKLLQSRIASKYGSTLLHLALESTKSEQVFKILRLNMDREMKRHVAMIRDNFGNNVLHEACQGSQLIFVQQIMANFSKTERLALIAQCNDRGSNCLRMAAKANNTEIFNFLLGQLATDPTTLRQCVFAECQSSPEKTVGHLLASQTSEESDSNYWALIRHMNKLKDLRSFLFQKGDNETLLHTILSNTCNTIEKQNSILGKLSFLFQAAESIGATQELLWCKRQGGRIPLYCLSLQPQISNMISEYVLGQLKAATSAGTDSLNYIRIRESKFGETALHSAARTNNLHVLHSLVCQIPIQKRFDYFLERSDLGSTPLHLAAYESDTLEAFRRILGYFGTTERHRLILNPDNEGNTPVLIAFISGNLEVVNSLLKEDWVPKSMIFQLMGARNHAGWTIIHLSCIRLAGDDLLGSVLSFMSYLPGIRLSPMIKHVDHNGNTALHLAALLYRPAVIRELLDRLKPHERRAYLLLRNNDGLMASQLCEMPDQVAVKYLQPLTKQDWTEEQLMHKKDYTKKEHTKLTLRDKERENRIQPTYSHCSDMEQIEKELEAELNMLLFA